MSRLPGYLMDIDLSQLNEHSESETLEFKETFDKQTLETIGAFSNTVGGIVLVGVRDDGKVIGINIGNNTLEEYAQKMQAKLQPRILPSITKQLHSNRTIVVISVERSLSLIAVDGRYFKRVGRTNQVMSPDEVKQRLLANSGSSWDSQIEENASIKDLDDEAIERFIVKLQEIGRRPVPIGHAQDDSLERLRLTVDGRPTRAAILLLGKDTKRFYPTAFIKAGRFKSATTILDDREFTGTLFQQMDYAMVWLQDRLEKRLVIDAAPTSKKAAAGDSLQREEVWQYPLPALRESIANAVCHRDYTSNVATTIRVYDKRLEIWNPGSLPPDLPPEALLREHTSHSPNQLLAECFFNTGIIERWGTGTLRMATALDEQDQPRPEFDVSAPNVFKVIMFATGFSDSKLMRLGLNSRQIQVIHYLKLKGAISSAEYQLLSGASKATATRDLSDLVQREFITRQGKSTAVTYELSQET